MSTSSGSFPAEVEGGEGAEALLALGGFFSFSLGLLERVRAFLYTWFYGPACESCDFLEAGRAFGFDFCFSAFAPKASLPLGGRLCARAGLCLGVCHTY